jgi:hypothetical protein
MRRIKVYNNEVPDRTMRIGRDTMKRSRDSARSRKRRADRGLPPTNFGRLEHRRIQGLFPEDDVVSDETVR